MIYVLQPYNSFVKKKMLIFLSGVFKFTSMLPDRKYKYLN